MTSLDPLRPSTQFVTPSGDERIDAIIYDWRYAGDQDGITRVSYSIPTESSTFPDGFVADGIDFAASFTPVPGWAGDVVREAADYISSISNLLLTEVEDTGDNFGVVRFLSSTRFTSQFDGWGFFPHPSEIGGNFMISERALNSGETPANIRLIIHELGHALGFVHPGSNAANLPSEMAGEEYTISFSRFQSAFFPNATYADMRATSLGYIDILAFRHLYGANDEGTAGDDTYQFDLSERYWETIFDLGGSDTIQFVGSGADVRIDLTPGTFLDVGTTVSYYDAFNSLLGTRDATVFVTPETVIENVYAAGGDDWLLGNTAANVLSGAQGADTLNGGRGEDTLDGGEGDDVLFGGTQADVLDGGAGADSLLGGNGNDTVAGGSGTDTLSGSIGDDSLNGGGSGDRLFGDDGADTLNGGGGSDRVDYLIETDSIFVDLETGEATGGFADGDVLISIESLFGGKGDDTLRALEAGSRLNGAGGDDIVTGRSGDDFLAGGNGNDVVTGGAGDDLMNGNRGDDTLDGGAGDDTLRGSTGADTFVFSAGAGDDIVLDFRSNDLIDLSATSTDFTSLADVQAAASETEAGLLIDLGGGDSLLLVGATLNTLTAVNLIF